MQTVTLNNGAEMPILGFGVYQIPAEELRRPSNLRSKSATGTSTPRRRTETRRLSAQRSGPRGRTWRPVEDDTKRAFESSLRRLGLDYVDLYVIHQPLGDYYSEWRAMQRLYGEGSIRAIGVSNFYPSHALPTRT
ncbi:aldo/keto reductase [Mumia sp. ZJ1417]|uniref:aldo/keto reductase n=3 Tax=Mumia TaxID=1546255 RepID=UPI001AB0385C|nr:aldo/keto reductase [Mumia sp. ZJ1417]